MTTKHPIVISSADWDDLIGIQFALGGQDRHIGLNCYGLVREVYRLMGTELPERTETAADDAIVAAESRDWIRVDEPRPYAVALMRVKPLPGDASGGQRYHLGIITPDMRLLHVLVRKGSVVSRLDKYAPMIAGYYVYAPGHGECFLPVGDGAVGKIIAGVLLTVVGAIGTVLGSAFGGVAWGPGLMKIGIGVLASGVIEGIASLFVSSTSTQIEDKSGESANYAWDGIANNFRQGSVKGMLFGRVKVGGQIISEKTWFDGDNNEYLDMLICPAHGMITRFSDIKINGTSVSAYENCSAVFRPGDDEQTAIDMFNRIYIQYLSAAKLSQTATEFSSKSKVGGFRLQITAPNGLYKVSKSSGNASAKSVEFRVQYKSSTIDWTDIPTGDPVYGTANPFFNRLAGAITGTANPYTLTDVAANFDDQIVAGDEFILRVGASVYYCTATTTATTEDAIEFNAFTDSGRTTAVTGAITGGAYSIDNGNLHYDIATSGSWRMEGAVPLVTGFTTDISCQAIKFTVEAGSDEFQWMRLKIWYRPSGGTWVLHDIFDAGAYLRDIQGSLFNSAVIMGRTYRVFEIKGLDTGAYQVAVEWTNDSNNPGATRSISNLGISNIYLDNTYIPGIFTITGDSDNPLHSVSKTIELLGLTRDNYDFRVWRTTNDASGTTRQDSVYLRGYAEVIDQELAYPGHALMGIRAMATDRLYGGRPTITAVATGAPLSVPGGTSCTVSADNGIIAGTGNLVNGINVDGMRSLTVSTALMPQVAGEYLWLVRMDSAGYADSGHLLTKWYCRVHAWSGSTVYIQNSEGIPAATSILLMTEASAPVDNLAWAVAKMLIVGSRGKITEANIDWESFAAFDVWCESQGYKYNALIDYSLDLWAIAFKAAAAGRGILCGGGGKYKVVIDKAAAPVQLFTEGNCNNVSVDFIPKSERANILTTSFLNEDQDFESADISEEDVQSTEYPWMTSLPIMVGVTSEAHCRSLLAHVLRQNRYIERTISFEAGIDSIETEIGDVFMFASQAHDFCFSGRLRSLFNGTATLDQAFTPEAGEVYRLTVWPSDGVPISWEGTLTGTGITSIPNAFPGRTMDEYYEYPYMIGILRDDKSRYRCMGIRRLPDTMFATITGIEYRDEVYAED